MKTLPFDSLERTSPSEKAISLLSHAIKQGELAVGSFLPPERELAARLKISRVVIREAAKKLEQRGLVRIRHGIGVEVVNNPVFPIEETIARLVPHTTARLRQSAEARLLIEPELAALAASRITPSASRRLEAVHHALTLDQKIDGAVENDVAFHDLIAELAGNQVLDLMLKSVVSIGRLSRQVTMERVGIRRASEHHQQILSQILAGNSAGARSAMKKHLQCALIDLA